ncbi:MAG: AAA family ATPase, partial [Spirochaetia bacterium]
LGGGNYDKAELNELLEGLKVPSIWITNSISRIPASAMRRFAHAYDFPRPDLRTRERMLTERLAQQEVSTAPRFARNTARRYDLSPAAIERLVSVMKAAEDPAVAAEDYLQAASGGPLSEEFRSLPAPAGEFDPQLCAADPPATELLEDVQRRSAAGRGVRLLFAGPPGGGKTQFALYLAAELGREAMVRKPSDLLSPYVGMAEKQIAAMFREARQSGAVLVLDEADALLGNRAHAQRSWELSQAAEFLQGIQEFPGILIACTNRVEHIDPALRRRFHRHAQFGALRADMLPAALERFFPQHTWAAEAPALKRLSAGPALMMSDIATAADVLEFAEAGDGVESGHDGDGLDTGWSGPNGTSQDRIVAEILSNAGARDMTRSVGF